VLEARAAVLSEALSGLSERERHAPSVLASAVLGESTWFAPFFGVAAAGVLVLAEVRDPAALADERASVAMAGASAFLRALEPGMQVPTLDPVPAAARDVADLLGPARAAGTVPREHPPQLPVPRSVADVLANIGSSYDDSTATGVPGTPKGVISVQQLTHPDGTRAWVVEVPGTQDWRPGSDSPMDLTTNVNLMAGRPDDLSTAIMESMRLAGVGADEPVLLAGHSQGGMAAMAVAAVYGSVYSIKAVVTAGSPDIPRLTSPDVQVRHYVHDEDLVPQLDGQADRRSSHETVVRRDLDRSGGPSGATPSEAHSVDLYAQSAAEAADVLADDPFMAPFDDAAASVLGPPGTTAVTFQFRATREPDVVATITPRLSQGQP
jgi:hypothetical protein